MSDPAEPSDEALGLPPGTLDKIDQVAEQAGVRVIIAHSGSAFGPSRVHRRLVFAAELAALAAIAAASAVPVAPAGHSAPFYPRSLPRNKSAAPGMDKQALQKMRRQHEQRARLASRYKSGR